MESEQQKLLNSKIKEEVNENSLALQYEDKLKTLRHDFDL